MVRGDVTAKHKLFECLCQGRGGDQGESAENQWTLRGARKVLASRRAVTRMPRHSHAEHSMLQTNSVHTRSNAQSKSACTLPYFTPSTRSSKTRFACSTTGQPKCYSIKATSAAFQKGHTYAFDSHLKLKVKIVKLDSTSRGQASEEGLWYSVEICRQSTDFHQRLIEGRGSFVGFAGDQFVFNKQRLARPEISCVVERYWSVG